MKAPTFDKQSYDKLTWFDNKTKHLFDNSVNIKIFCLHTFFFYRIIFFFNNGTSHLLSTSDRINNAIPF